MKSLRENWCVIAPWMCFIIAIAGVVIGAGKWYLRYKNPVIEEVDCMELYRSTIEPAMMNGNVRTRVSVRDADGIAEVEYAIHDSNSMVRYYRNDSSGRHLFEVWNNMEQYYMMTVVDGEEVTYKINVTEDTRDELNNCVYSCFMSVVSYLGVANPDRIVSFGDAGDGQYKAVSEIGGYKYELLFYLFDGSLASIDMKNDNYPDTTTRISFSKYNIAEQSDLENTDKECDVSDVLKVFEDGT